MSVPNNIFSPSERLQNTLGAEDFFESRFENDANANPIYAAWSPIPNAATADSVWYIKKIYYDANQGIARVQLPDDGVKFSYSFDDRASYFS